VLACAGQESQEREPSPAVPAVFVLARARIDNIAYKRHAVAIMNPMTLSEVVWGVRAEVHLTEIAENDRGIENQKLRILVPAPPLDDLIRSEGLRNPSTVQHRGFQERHSKSGVAFAHGGATTKIRPKMMAVKRAFRKLYPGLSR
jgi:hypothetical protein